MKLLVIDAVGLRPKDLAQAPNIRALADEGFLAPLLEAGSPRLASRLSRMTLSIWISSTSSRKCSFFENASNCSVRCFDSWSY